MATFLTGAIGQLADRYNNAKTGSWGTKDLGITEGISDLLGRQRNAQGGSSFRNSYAQSPAPTTTSALQYNTPAGPSYSGTQGVLGAGTSTPVIRTGSGAPAPQQTSGQQNYSNALNAGLTQDQNNIEAEYQQEISRLGGLENTTRSNYQGAIDQAAQYYPQFQELLSKEKGNDIGSVDARENQVKQESQSALSRTRALLADLQRRQGAQLSATGNYSSSASDAMGESFGKQAFGALSDVQKQRDQALAQVAIQRQSVENFYSRKAVETKQSYDQQMMSLQQQLNAQLDQINNAKGAAESAKRAASVDAWRNFTNNKLQLDQYMMQYQDSLDQWKQQMDTQLQGAVGYEADFSGVGSINPNFDPTQQQAQTTDNSGSAITYAKSIKGNTLEDYLAQQQQQYK